MASGSFTGEEHSHKRSHEQSKLCGCKVDKLAQDLTQVKSSIEEMKSSLKEMTDVFKSVQAHLPQLLISTLPSNASSLPHQTESSASWNFQLCFEGAMPDSLLTKINIEDEGASLTLQLYDDSGEKVVDGPESCLKVELVTLDGDFDVENRVDWTEEDFKSYVLSPRTGKGALLKAESSCKLSLSGGCATVRGISFTDNSSKVAANGKFRLGAHVITNPSSGRVVRPAVSNPFTVKENRLKTDRKHRNPSLEDDLWRLFNINKTGKVYGRAAGEGVCKVKDFLKLYHTDEKKLQDILGVYGKKWAETVKHARSCSLTNEHYQYYDDASGDYLILDCVFKIKSVTFKGQICQLYESLDFTQKKRVGKLREAAYEKRNDLPTFDAATDQIPVQSGFVYPSSVQEQQQPVAPPPNMCPNAGELSVGTYQIHCYPTTNMQNPCTTAAYPVQSWPTTNFTTSACLSTDPYGGYDTSLANQYLTQQPVNYALLNETLGPARNSSINLQYCGALQENPGDSQRLENDSCHLDTLSLSDIFLNVSDFCDGPGEESRKNQYRLRWCHLRAIVVSGICRMRKSTNAVTSSRFEKKQRVVY